MTFKVDPFFSGIEGDDVYAKADALLLSRIKSLEKLAGVEFIDGGHRLIQPTAPTIEVEAAPPPPKQTPRQIVAEILRNVLLHFEGTDEQSTEIAAIVTAVISWLISEEASNAEESK